jgi:hypothetical protein
MGDYLLLSWLCTRRGLTVFLLLVFLTAAGNLYRLASEREQSNPPTVKASRTWDIGHRTGGPFRRDDAGVKETRHPPKWE